MNTKFIAGIRSLSIEGILSIVFRPMLDEMPVLGGMQMFMINPPDIDIEWHG